MKEGTHRWLLALPILGFLALLPVFVFSDLDLRIQEKFFDQATQSWPGEFAAPWYLLNAFGEVPALLLGVASIAILLLAIGRPKLHRHRKSATFVLCALLLGPGLLVNGLFKTVYERSRPNATEVFGGGSPFRPFLHLNPVSKGSSLPSGHASMGFFTMCIGLLFLAAGRRRTAASLLTLSLLLGFVIGTSRVVSGKHYTSDVLFAGLLVWLSTLVVYYRLRMHRSPEFEPCPDRNPTRFTKIFRNTSPLLILLLVLGVTALWFRQAKDRFPPGPPLPESHGPRLSDGAHQH